MTYKEHFILPKGEKVIYLYEIAYIEENGKEEVLIFYQTIPEMGQGKVGSIEKSRLEKTDIL